MKTTLQTTRDTMPFSPDSPTAVRRTITPTAPVRAATLRVCIAAIFAISGGCSTTHGSGIHPPGEVALLGADPRPLEKLKDEFRADYDAAIAANTEQLKSSGPLVVNDLLSMTLYLPGNRKERFRMGKATYMLMADTTHPPLALYSILAPVNFDSSSSATQARLRALDVAIVDGQQKTATEVQDPQTLARINHVLGATGEYVSRLLNGAKTTRVEFRAFAAGVRDDLRRNLYVGAREQLRQFKSQLDQWRVKYPGERWENLRVAVIGFHQARQDYALTLFFKWLLREGAEENRVVFVEFQHPVFGKSEEAQIDWAEKAQSLSLTMVSKVEFDREAAELFFGDAHVLQHDVMGPAAAEILREWGPPPPLRTQRH